MLSFDTLLVWMWGWRVLLYLGLSVVLGGGLHPLAAHLIAEHYNFSGGKQQETYSCMCGYCLYDVWVLCVYVRVLYVRALHVWCVGAEWVLCLCVGVG